MFSVGGLGAPAAQGMMKQRTTYGDSSCSSLPTSMSFTPTGLTCTPQADRSRPICEDGEAANFVSDCNYYDLGGHEGDTLEMFRQPYLAVETYKPGKCLSVEGLISASIYRLDENCHPNAAGTASHRLTLDESATFTIYTDANCTNVASITTIPKEATEWEDRKCIDDRYAYFKGAELQQTTVAVFDNSACSNPPVKVTTSTVFKCKASPDGNAAPCESGDGSHFSVSTCSGSSGEDMYGADQPWLMVVKYLGLSFSGRSIETTMIYSADGICHSDTNETNFIAGINLEDSTARITAYSDTTCTVEATDLELNRLQLGRSVGGLGAPRGSPISKLAKVVYDEGTCSSISTIFVVAGEEKCPVTPQCTTSDMKSSSSAYYAVECYDDLEAFATAKLNNTPYLIIETYKEGTDCSIQESVVVYSADGECHVNVIDGPSFRVRPSIGDSITVATYPNALCIDSDADYITMGAKYINTDACFKGNMKLHASMTAFTAFYADSPVSPPKPGTNIFDQKSREQILFPEWLWELKPRRIFESA